MNYVVKIHKSLDNLNRVNKMDGKRRKFCYLNKVRLPLKTLFSLFIWVTVNM